MPTGRSTEESQRKPISRKKGSKRGVEKECAPVEDCELVYKTGGGHQRKTESKKGGRESRGVSSEKTRQEQQPQRRAGS